MPMFKAAVCGCLLLLSGCVLMPDYVGVEAEHQSHLTQHFGPNQTNFGSEQLNLNLTWSKPRSGFYGEISEGVDVDPCRGEVCGEIYGPREQTQIRGGYRWKVKPDVFITVKEDWAANYKESKEYKTVVKYGGQVEVVDRQSTALSTTKIVQRAIGGELGSIFKDFMDLRKDPLKER